MFKHEAASASSHSSLDQLEHEMAPIRKQAEFSGSVNSLDFSDSSESSLINLNSQVSNLSQHLETSSFVSPISQHSGFQVEILDKTTQ